MSLDGCGCCGCLCGRFGKILPSVLLLKLVTVGSGLTDVQVAGCKLVLGNIPYTWTGNLRVFDSSLTSYDLVTCTLTCPASTTGGVDLFTGLTYRPYQLVMTWSYSGGGSLTIPLLAYPQHALSTFLPPPGINYGCPACNPPALLSATTLGVQPGTFVLPSVGTVAAVVETLCLNSIGYNFGTPDIYTQNTVTPGAYTKLYSAGSGVLYRFSRTNWFSGGVAGFPGSAMNGTGGAGVDGGATLTSIYCSVPLGVFGFIDGMPPGLNSWGGAPSAADCCVFDNPLPSACCSTFAFHCSDFEDGNTNSFTCTGAALSLPHSNNPLFQGCNPYDGIAYVSSGFSFPAMIGTSYLMTPTCSYYCGNPTGANRPTGVGSAGATEDPGASPCWPMSGVIRYVMHSSGYGDGSSGSMIYGGWKQFWAGGWWFQNNGFAGWLSTVPSNSFVLAMSCSSSYTSGPWYGSCLGTATPSISLTCQLFNHALNTPGHNVIWPFTGDTANHAGDIPLTVTVVNCKSVGAPFYATTNMVTISASGSPWNGATIWFELFGDPL